MIDSWGQEGMLFGHTMGGDILWEGGNELNANCFGRSESYGTRPELTWLAYDHVGYIYLPWYNI
jgi:hypothetical protein